MNTPTDDDRSHRPFWFNFVFYLIGRPPALTRHQWRVLGLVSIVSLFEQYDVYLFSLNLKQIQADLGIAESSLGWIASAVRAGAFFALPLTLAADRLGRRRVLLYTILGYTLCTGATAFAPDAATFVALQFLARMFAAAEAVIAVVVVAEEFDAAHRGWGIGALGAIHAVGAGMAGGFFALVAVLPYGWRALYLVGLVPLLLTAHLRRTLPETARFDALRRDREGQRSSSLAPAIELVRRHPGRIGMLAVAVFAIEIVAGPATFFAPKFLQESHGWRPEAVSMLVSMGGALGTIGNPVAGWLSDRRGRKPVTLLFTLFVTVAILSFYLLDGRLAGALWIPMIFGFMGTQVTLAAYGAELFATRMRSTGSGVREVCKTGGVVAGLAAVSVLFGYTGSNGNAIVLLCGVGALAPLCVLLFFPETAGRRLEEIAADVEPCVKAIDREAWRSSRSSASG